MCSGIILWKYGKSTIEDIKSKGCIASYISKYMIKSLKEIEDTIYMDRLNKRRYYSSLKLIKLIINYSNEFSINEYYSIYRYDKYNSYNKTIIKNFFYT